MTARMIREVLPLESGDRLTRSEFERRYQMMPHVKKAELIEGVVYMPSPTRFQQHAQPHARVIGWLLSYTAATPGAELGDNATVRLGADNEVQPDALLRLESGTSHLSGDDYLEGAPELIVEIAASSASYDLHDKLRVYRRDGVREYLVWRVYDERFDWFYLQDGAYEPLQPNEAGMLESQVFPGLRLAVQALLEGDMARVLAELQRGVDSAEHATFVKRLREVVGEEPKDARHDI